MQLENLLFILLIAIAVLFRLLASKVGEAKKGSQPPDQRSTTRHPPVDPITRAPAESDAERIRRFLEALGQPADTKPPPPVAPRTDIPPRPLAPVQPPSPIPTARNVLTRRKRQIVEAPKPPAPPVFEPREAPPPRVDSTAPVEPSLEPYAVAAESKPKDARTGTDIATLLRSPAGQRNAIILREIFGPPRSLQPLDLVGSA